MKNLFAITVLCATASAGAAEFRLPAFDTTRLPNGLTVYLMERHEAPLIAVSAVLAFQRRYYRADNAAIIVVGDFKMAEMRARISELFGSWRAQGAPPVVQQNGKVKADKARVWLVNKADATETTFVIGGAGIARNDPDYVPLEVLNTVLGGRFTSWLNEELRIIQG